MDNCKHLAQRLLVFTLLGIGLCAPAFAYIDPNAGGMLFQLLAPLFAAVVGAWLFLRRWLADLVRRLLRRLTGSAKE